MSRITVTRKVHFRTGGQGRKELQGGQLKRTVSPGRVPRVARLMALAIRFDRLVRHGAVAAQYCSGFTQEAASEGVAAEFEDLMKFARLAAAQAES